MSRLRPWIYVLQESMFNTTSTSSSLSAVLVTGRVSFWLIVLERDIALTLPVEHDISRDDVCEGFFRRRLICDSYFVEWVGCFSISFLFWPGLGITVTEVYFFCIRLYIRYLTNTNRHLLQSIKYADFACFGHLRRRFNSEWNSRLYTRLRYLERITTQ